MYSTEGWGEFFLASAGATAALAGLIFVGLSVNVRTVLELDKDRGNLLTGRAIEGLVALLNVLVLSLVALTPNISRAVLVVVILVVATESGISPTRAFISTRGQSELMKSTAVRLVMAYGLVAVYVIAGITLAAESGGGLDWLLVAFILAIAVAAINAWVLLVEILR